MLLAARVSNVCYSTVAPTHSERVLYFACLGVECIAAQQHYGHMPPSSENQSRSKDCKIWQEGVPYIPYEYTVRVRIPALRLGHVYDCHTVCGPYYCVIPAFLLTRQDARRGDLSMAIIAYFSGFSVEGGQPRGQIAVSYARTRTAHGAGGPTHTTCRTAGINAQDTASFSV